MSGRFGPGAARLAGLAGRVLAWSPQTFWAATPAELAAVLTPAAASEPALSRDDFNRLMERDDG